MSLSVLYISITLPSRTLNFVTREIEALERLGVRVRTLSMNRPSEDSVAVASRPLIGTTLFLDSVSVAAKLRATLIAPFARPRAFGRALRRLFSARVRSGTELVRISYHFIEACYASRHYRDAGIDRIHCHILSGPTSIGMFLAALLGIPFSFTIHGSHVYRFPIALAAKVRHADFVVSVSDVHRRYVVDEYARDLERKFHTIRAGLDLAQLPAVDRRSRAPGPVRLLSVASLFPLKGLHHVVRACAMLQDRGCGFVYTIVGEGPQRAQLEELVRSLDLESCVTLVGARTQDDVPGFYRESDVFVLAPVQDPDGGRDGLPVVLMEAMASGLPVISSDFVGIPELVENGLHGYLTPPGGEVELADALERLIESPDLRESLGRRGRERILSEFDVRQSAEKLLSLFTSATTTTET